MALKNSGLLSIPSNAIDNRSLSDKVIQHCHEEISPVADTLEIEILRGRDLAAKDTTGESDPFAKLKCGPLKYKTKTIKQTRQPIWKESFIFAVSDLEKHGLHIELWDEDKVKNDYLGELV